MFAGTLTAPVTASTPLVALPTFDVDPVDRLLVDIATGRFLPGETVHVQQIASEHGLDETEAQAALDGLWELGFVAKQGCLTSGVVVWRPGSSQLHLHRLARLMVASLRTSQRDDYAYDVIDGEGDRITAVELFGLTVPCDLELFLELARALLGRLAPHILDELVVPTAVMFSVASQRVHDLELAATTAVRQELVCEMVRALLDGRTADFTDLVADYVLAMSVS